MEQKLKKKYQKMHRMLKFKNQFNKKQMIKIKIRENLNK